MNYKYLNQEHLSGFEHYKYSAVDTSPLSQYVMHPFWNAVVKLCPLWVAPNLLTFSGFVFTVSNFLLFCYYDYSFYASSVSVPEYAPIPRWVWFAAAFTLFLAHTLDGIDGKQARRTGTSGPIGELFDHGLDSWTTVLIPTGLYSIFGRADYSIPPIHLFFCLWNVHLNFLLSHWEKYNTGVLFLPWGYDFAMVTTFVLYVFTLIFGYQTWKITLPGGINCGMLFELLLYGGSLASSLPTSFYNVWKSYQDGSGKMRPFWEAVRPLVSPVILFLLTLLWVILSPTDIINTEPRCFFFLVGTLFSHICCRLIVAQMSNTRCEMLNWLLGPVALVVLVSLAFPVGSTAERCMLYAVTVLATQAHVHYGICVVRQMCRHFRIECFRIKQQND